MNVAFATPPVNSQSDISERYACHMDRVARMREIIDDRFDGVQADFAKAIGRSPSVVWQYLSGHRTIGEKFARHVERKLNLPTNYLDRTSASIAAEMESVQPSIDANVSEGPEIKGKVPLISWVQAGSAQEAIDLFQPGVADEWVPTSAPIREHTYALRIEGDSMSPKFQPGMQIIVEPDMPCENGSYVIAKNQDGETTFKRLVKDAGVWLLKPENSQYPTLRLDDGYSIIGVVRRAEIVLC